LLWTKEGRQDWLRQRGYQSSVGACYQARMNTYVDIFFKNRGISAICVQPALNRFESRQFGD
jgi:hypothetical protein